MDLEGQRKKMGQHIRDQALFQGKRVKVSFLREADGEEVFEVQSAKGSAEVRLSRESLSLKPSHLWEIDEKIAAALSSI